MVVDSVQCNALGQVDTNQYYSETVRFVHSFIAVSSFSCLYISMTSPYKAYPPFLSASSALRFILSPIQNVLKLLFRYHSIISPCPKIHALNRGVQPPIVYYYTLHPALTSSSKIYNEPTAAAQCRAVLPIESLRWIWGWKCSVALTKLTEEIDAANMSSVCEEWVSGVLMAGMILLTKEQASWGVHWGICMHASHICMLYVDTWCSCSLLGCMCVDYIDVRMGCIINSKSDRSINMDVALVVGCNNKDEMSGDVMICVLDYYQKNTQING